MNVFVSLDRNLSGEECHELAEKYFETHKRTTLPGQALRVDLRPAFRKPLADVTPKFPRRFQRPYFHATAMNICTHGEPNAASQRNRLREILQPFTRCCDSRLR
jgi:hypothetical protein